MTLNRRRFLVGLGAWAGVALMLRAEPVIFDMGVVRAVAPPPPPLMIPETGWTYYRAAIQSAPGLVGAWFPSDPYLDTLGLDGYYHHPDPDRSSRLEHYRVGPATVYSFAMQPKDVQALYDTWRKEGPLTLDWRTSPRHA